MNRTVITRYIDYALAIALLLALMLPNSGAIASAQDERTFFWRAYDTEITIRADGTFRVQETQIVAFNGTFGYGSRVIPLNRVEEINNIRVSVATSQSETAPQLTLSDRDTKEVGTYLINDDDNSVEIRYYFEPTRGEEDRVIVIEYDVVGGLRFYPHETPANQQIWWIAVSSDVTGSADVETSTVIVHLPERVSIGETIWRPSSGTTNGRTWVWQWSNLKSGLDYGVRLQFPPITDAEVTTWQSAEELTATPVED